jgi:CRISPR-associated protein Csm4
VSAAIHGEDETRPYVVGVRYFGRETGLYVIIATENEEQESAMYDLLLGLSYSGIGGKRRAGIGRFVIVKEKVLDSKMFEQTSKCVMSMSISLPKEDEMEMAMEGSHVQMKKRGGFVTSETYADEPLKKRELFMLAAGSTFAKRFTGDVYDVTVAGNHPVYRYGKPMFLALPEVE